MERIREYRLKYLWGAWVTHAPIYAESDAEAIHDADEEYEKSALPLWPYDVALFLGRRRVKTYKGAGA